MGLTSRIYFFINKRDIEQYFEWLSSNYKIGLIPYGPHQKLDDNSLESCLSIYELERFISLENSKYGLSSDNSFFIKFPDVCEKIYLKYIQEQNYYLIVEDISKLVRFSFGGLYKNKTLISGFMDIYKKSYDKDGEEIIFSDLVDRFKEMTKWFRKNNITKAANQYYVMPGAYELAKKGYKLKVDNDLAFGFHIGASGGLEGYYEDKGLKITDDGILTSQVDWSEEAKKNIWKEFPGC
jgi:hypothetical protein